MKWKKTPIWLGISALVLIGFVLLPVLVSGSDVTEADPLISLSYLNGTFQREVSSEAANNIESERKTLEKTLDAHISSVQTASGAASGDGTTHTKVQIQSGSAYTVPEGAEFLFLSGEATVSEARLTDVTAGAVPPESGALTVNHLYIANGAVTLHAAQASSLLIRK